MQERLERVETKVDGLTNVVTTLDGRAFRLEDNVSSLGDKVTRLDEKFSSLDGKVARLDEKVASLDGKVTRLDEKFSSLDGKVTRLDEKVSSLNDQVAHLGTKIDIQVESLRELVQRTAEGYGATLESMVRDLADFRSEIRVKAADTDLIVRDHERRITVLEQQSRT